MTFLPVISAAEWKEITHARLSDTTNEKTIAVVEKLRDHNRGVYDGLNHLCYVVDILCPDKKNAEVLKIAVSITIADIYETVDKKMEKQLLEKHKPNLN